MPSISILIPAYNEEAALQATFERCIATVRACANDYEIIILDDCSRDTTPSLIRQIIKSDPERIHAIFHGKNMGISASFKDLYEAAQKEYVFLVPADGEFPPEALIDAMPLLDKFDIVICKRIKKKYTLYRHIISGSYRWFTALLFGVDLVDPGSTKITKKNLLTKIPIVSRGVYAEAERLIRASYQGYNLGFVPITQENRKGGRASGANFRIVLQAVFDMIRVRIHLTKEKRSHRQKR